MTCEDSQTFLHAFLDDELDVGENLRVQQHLATCVRCRQVQEEQLALRSALHDPGLYSEVSPEFAARINKAVRAAAAEEAAKLEKAAPRPRWVGFLESIRWVPVAAVALAVLSVAGVLTFNRMRTSQEQLMADAALASHIRSLQPGHLIDVESSDRHTVKPWFQGKLDFAPPVPDLSDLGWALIGGRLDYMDGRPVAALVYQRRMHNINVFLWPNQGSMGGSTSDIQQQDAQGYQILHWKGTDMTYWVVSDLNQSELLEFAKALRGH
jgi:anti-sigma factor RsiW